MKDVLKAMGVFFVGLLVAVIIYPVLHEAGHSVAAIAVGATVEEFNLFPLPNVLCNISGVSNIGQVVIGLGGMLLPILLSVLPTKSFWMWYASLLLKGIGLLSLIISGVATVLFCMGSPVANEDITQVLRLWREGWIVCLFAISALSVWLIVKIIREKPIERCLLYFEVPIKREKASAA